MLDLALWLNPIDGENPSGRDLRETREFDALGRLMQARVDIVRDERNNPVSKTLVPVDWAAVLQKADELRAHGRDLRLLVIVARALLNERGLDGLAEGLTLIARTVEAHWETLHPELRTAARPSTRPSGASPRCGRSRPTRGGGGPTSASWPANGRRGCSATCAAGRSS